MLRKTIISAALILVAAFAAGPAAADVKIGSAAPDFSLPSADGTRTVRLKDEIGSHKLAVVMFIATRCPFSNGYNERMEKLQNDYASRGVAFLGINSNVSESAGDVVDHARKHGFTFAVLKDAESKVADLYDAQKTPEIFVIDSTGLLRYHGRIDENAQDAGKVKSPDLRNALDALLAGKPVAAAETKAFGCGIKRP